MKKIFIIAGTRPELIKLCPVYAEFQSVKGVDVKWISTGQHKEMLEPLYKLFAFAPDHNMRIMTKGQTLALMTERVLNKCVKLFTDERPDFIIVQGDTTTAMVAGLAAFYLKIPVGHIEAGLRSFNKDEPFPEEVNRRIIGLVADMHFAPTRLSAAHLKAEKLPGKISVVGNTVIDSLQLVLKKSLNNKHLEKVYHNLHRPYRNMVLITCHRRENFGRPLENICNAIRKLAEKHPDTSFVYPVHMNPNVRNTVHSLLNEIDNIFLLEPLPYDHLVYLMSKSKMILSDSGGIQEEAPSLGKPVLVLRNNTERPEGIEAGCCKLIGTSEKSIVSFTNKLLTNPAFYRSMANVRNPYGDGKSAGRIVKQVIKFVL
jgi:UDP-N-acetylglucosamine 2-epimerase (non-hydrolysing)